MIPFSFLPDKSMKALAGHFLGIGGMVSKSIPSLKPILKQIDLNYSAEEYGAIVFLNAFFYFVLVSVLASLLLEKFIENGMFLGVLLGMVASFLILIQITLYPSMLLKKRVREIEQNLSPALRTMLIQIRSGIPLFQTLQIIAKEKYGILSKEFEKTVKEINAGKPQEEALQELASKNPSPALRKAIWQVVNGLKAGGETGSVLKESVSTLNSEERTEIRKYGSDLRLLSLMYMMIGVVIPTLGLTFLIVIGSFPKITIGDTMLWILLALVIVMNFMYIGMIKSKRPTLMR